MTPSRRTTTFTISSIYEVINFVLDRILIAARGVAFGTSLDYPCVIASRHTFSAPALVTFESKSCKVKKWQPLFASPFLGFKWPQELVYTRGIHFSHDLKQANTFNFEEKVCSLEKNTQQLEKKKANFNWQNQYCQDIRFVETHILQFVTDRI